MIRANLDRVSALAGAFIMLPLAAILLLCPPPDTKGVTDSKAVLAIFQTYLTDNALALLAAALIVSIGSLAVMALFIDRSRPTVASAIRIGAACLIPAILAQILFGMGFGLVLVVLMGGAAVTKSAAVIALAMILCLALLIWAAIRLQVLSATIVAERHANPVTALARAFALTEGNFWRLFGFFLLVGIAVAIVAGLIGGAVTVLGALVAGDSGASILGGLIQGVTQAASSVLSVALIAASYRQLSGDAQHSASTFE